MTPEKTLYQPAEHAVLDARMQAADKPGKHMWVMTAGWLIADPESAFDPDIPTLMDAENLIILAGPGCYKCELPYSKGLTYGVCKGTAE